MNEEIKRGRGRPPKNVDAPIVPLQRQAPMVVDLENIVTDNRSRDGEAWALFVSAILSTYNGMGPAVIRSACLNADEVMREYKRRYP